MRRVTIRWASLALILAASSATAQTNTSVSGVAGANALYPRGARSGAGDVHLFVWQEGGTGACSNNDTGLIKASWILGSQVGDGITPPTLIGTLTSDGGCPSVSFHSNGYFVVVWANAAGEILGTLIDEATKTPAATPFRVHAGQGYGPEVDTNGENGDYVVAFINSALDAVICRSGVDPTAADPDWSSNSGPRFCRSNSSSNYDLDPGISLEVAPGDATEFGYVVTANYRAMGKDRVRVFFFPTGFTGGTPAESVFGPCQDCNRSSSAYVADSATGDRQLLVAYESASGISGTRYNNSSGGQFWTVRDLTPFLIVSGTNNVKPLVTPRRLPATNCPSGIKNCYLVSWLDTSGSPPVIQSRTVSADGATPTLGTVSSPAPRLDGPAVMSATLPEKPYHGVATTRTAVFLWPDTRNNPTEIFGDWLTGDDAIVLAAGVEDFRAVGRSSRVDLSWRGTFELGIVGYEVERASGDGWDLVEAVSVAPPSSYQVTDEGPGVGSVTYQLVAERSDGSSEVIAGPVTTEVREAPGGCACTAATRPEAGLAWLVALGGLAFALKRR